MIIVEGSFYEAIWTVGKDGFVLSMCGEIELSVPCTRLSIIPWACGASDCHVDAEIPFFTKTPSKFIIGVFFPYLSLKKSEIKGLYIRFDWRWTIRIKLTWFLRGNHFYILVGLSLSQLIGNKAYFTCLSCRVCDNIFINWLVVTQLSLN